MSDDAKQTAPDGGGTDATVIALPPRRRPVVPPKAAELVAEEIRSAIARGELTSGQKLPAQPELAERFEVSAPTMREAVRILETEGLIRVQRGVNGGTIVQGPSLDAMSRQLGIYLQMSGATIADGFASRLALEIAAVRRLAENFTDEVEAQLLAAIDETEAAVASSEGIASHGAQFHLLLLRCCGSVSLAALGLLISELIERLLETSIKQFPDEVVSERAEPAIQQMRRLVQFLKEGDAAAAERHWRKALSGQLRLLQEYGLADQPMLFR